MEETSEKAASMTTREFQTFAFKQLGKIDGVAMRVEDLATRIAVLDTVVKMIDYKGVDERLSRIEREHEATEARIKVWTSLALSMGTLVSAVVAASLAHVWK
jgi:hypothetical protein